MTDHAVYEERICALLDGELSAEDESSLRAHLAECADCRAFLAAMEAVYGLAAKDLPEAPADLAQNVMERVRAEAKAAKKTGKIIRFPYKPLAAAAAAALVLWAGARVVPGIRPKGMSASAPAAEAAQEYSVMAAGADMAVAEEEASPVDAAPMTAADSAAVNSAAYGAAAPEAAPKAAEPIYDYETAMYAAAESRDAGEPLPLTVRGGEVLIDGEPVPFDELAERLTERGAADTGVELDGREAEAETLEAVGELLEALGIPVL